MKKIYYLAGAALLLAACSGKNETSVNENSEGSAVEEVAVEEAVVATDTASQDSKVMEGVADTVVVEENVQAKPEKKAEVAAEKEKINIKITPGKLKKDFSDYSESWKSTMTVTLKNLSSSPVSGKDYTISYKSKEWGAGSENPKSKTVTRTAKGIDLGPNATGHITITRTDADKFSDFKIVRK